MKITRWSIRNSLLYTVVVNNLKVFTKDDNPDPKK